MHSAATESSSTTIACMRFPAAIRIAVSYFDSVWPSCAIVPWTPLIFPLSRASRIAATALVYPRFKLSATSASAFIAVYWRVSSRIADWSSVCCLPSSCSSFRFA